jgi:phage shock protein PspC (stress-responsive transcriptional regulator)
MTETTSHPTPPTPPPGPADGFDRLRALGIARPAEGRWVGGVAAGLARRWNLDPLLVRGVLVALTILSGVGLLAYGIAWALLPEDDGTIHLEAATKGDITAGLVGSGIFVLLFAVMGGHNNGPGPAWWGLQGIVAVAVIGGGIWWWANRNKAAHPGTPAPPGAVPPGGGGTAPYGTAPYGTAPYGTAPYGSAPYGTAPYGSAPYGTYPGGTAPYGTYPGAGGPRPQGAPYTGGPAYGAPPHLRPPIPPPPPKLRRRDRPGAASRKTTRLTLGLAVLAAVAVILADRIADGFDDVHTGVVTLCAATGVVALGIMVAGARGRRSGGLAPIGILLGIALVITTGLSTADFRSTDRLEVVGDTDWRPTTAVEAELDYTLGVGDGTLWLTDPGILSGRTGTEPLQAMAQVGAGTLTVVVPEGTPVEVRGELAGGQLVRPDGSRVRFDGSRTDDVAEIVRTGPAGAPAILVEARAGFGEIVIRTGTPSGSVSPATPAPTPSPAPSATPSPAPSGTPPAAPSATTAPTVTPEATP